MAGALRVGGPVDGPEKPRRAPFGPGPVPDVGQWGCAGNGKARQPMRMILDPAVVATYVGRVDPALRLDEPRARAVARLLDELRRTVRAASALRGRSAA